MQDATIVRVPQRFRELNTVALDLFDGKWASRKPRAKRLSFNELHRDVRLAIGFADFVNGADVRMVQRGDRARLAHESRPRARVIEAVRRKELDRDVAMQVLVLGAIDLAHPASAQSVDDAVVSEPLTGARQLHGPGRV